MMTHVKDLYPMSADNAKCYIHNSSANMYAHINIIHEMMWKCIVETHSTLFFAYEFEGVFLINYKKTVCHRTYK